MVGKNGESFLETKGLWSFTNTIKHGRPWGYWPPTTIPAGGHSSRANKRIANGFHD